MIKTKHTHYDYLIVGAGLFGAVFAQEAKRRGKRCLIVERRTHRGGNIYCEEIEGIRVHKYGAHIFHTSNKMVWDYVQKFADFNRYTNSPLANYKGKLYNLPFNMNTFYQLWGVRTPQEAEQKLAEQRAGAEQKLLAAGVTNPRNLEEQALSLVGEDIYSILIKGYTEKQWGRSCAELPAFIIKRLPLRLVYDNNYFNDLYQGIPIGGYNVLIDNLLEDTEVYCGIDYLAHRDELDALADKTLYTGAIDEFFECKLGRLQYRSIHFEQEIHDQANYQGNAVVNYTEKEIPYTRIIEHKHFEMFGDAVYQNKKTVISKEYSVECHEGIEPYYPINDVANNSLYESYRALAKAQPRYLFGGRLADYKYYDMHHTVERALELAFDELGVDYVEQ